MTTPTQQPFSLKRVIKRFQPLPLILAALYLWIVQYAMGLRIEHFALAGFFVGCFYLPIYPKARQFILDFLPFALFGTLYDFLRVFPKNWAGPIQVVWPHRLESILFGFSYEGRQIIPCDYFLIHSCRLLDVVTALTYSLHVVVPLVFAVIVWVKDRPLFQRFAWAFFLANIMAFVTYIALPVAPPWYVEQYGFVPANWSLISSAAGLVRFDHLIGYPYFEGVYGKSAWVFGAVPSMHAGFPFLVFLFARHVFKKGLIPILGFMFLVWFSAVYLSHHYIIDLIAGVLYAFLAYRLVIGLFPWKNQTENQKISSPASSR
jgi:hypothetical protein